jgi:hypothetical protein
MKIALYSSLLIVSSSFAISLQSIPEENYGIHVGLGNEAIVDGTNLKELKEKRLPQQIQKLESVGVDYSDAILFSKLSELSKNDKANSGLPNSNNLVNIPSTLVSDYSKYKASNQIASPDSLKSEDNNKFLVLKCSTFKDYKITKSANIKMMCKDRNLSGGIYKLSAILEVGANGNDLTLSATPYMIEDVKGKYFEIIKEKSRLTNGINGDSNLATYVDKKAMESVVKAMGDTFATDSPTLTKDYLEKKNASDDTVTSNGDTIIVASETPKPVPEDYGIALLVNVVGSGLKAGFDQLYRDLGYIYYMPKESVVDAEIVIKL